VDPFASVVTEPLEVVGTVLAVAGLFGGFLGAAELLRGGGAQQIANEAARGSAVGFLIGIPVAIAVAVIIAFT
jgi:hypothetical protein